MTQIGRPGIRATDSYDDIDALVSRIDKPISERYMRLKHGVQAYKIHDQWQYMETTIGGRQVYTDFAMELVLLTDQRMFDLFELGQNRCARPVEQDSCIGQRQRAGGAIE